MVGFSGLLAMFPSFCGLPPGPDFRHTNFSGGRDFRILLTHTFRVAVTVAFYLHPLFGLPSPSHLHFTYTNFSGGRGFAFYPHTLSGRFLSKIEKNDLKFENFPRWARPFS